MRTWKNLLCARCSLQLVVSTKSSTFHPKFSLEAEGLVHARWNSISNMFVKTKIAVQEKFSQPFRTCLDFWFGIFWIEWERSQLLWIHYWRRWIVANCDCSSKLISNSINIHIAYKSQLHQLYHVPIMIFL